MTPAELESLNVGNWFGVDDWDETVIGPASSQLFTQLDPVPTRNAADLPDRSFSVTNFPKNSFDYANKAKSSTSKANLSLHRSLNNSSVILASDSDTFSGPLAFLGILKGGKSDSSIATETKASSQLPNDSLAIASHSWSSVVFFDTESAAWKRAVDDLRRMCPLELREAFFEQATLRQVLWLAGNKRLKNGKVPLICLAVDAVNHRGACTLKDDTGHVGASIAKVLLQTHQGSIRSGSVFVLKNCSCFSASSSKQHLVITVRNLVAVYQQATKESDVVKIELLQLSEDDFGTPEIVDENSVLSSTNHQPLAGNVRSPSHDQKRIQASKARLEETAIPTQTSREAFIGQRFSQTSVNVTSKADAGYLPNRQSAITDRTAEIDSRKRDVFCAALTENTTEMANGHLPSLPINCSSDKILPTNTGCRVGGDVTPSRAGASIPKRTFVAQGNGTPATPRVFAFKRLKSSTPMTALAAPANRSPACDRLVEKESSYLSKGTCPHATSAVVSSLAGRCSVSEAVEVTDCSGSERLRQNLDQKVSPCRPGESLKAVNGTSMKSSPDSSKGLWDDEVNDEDLEAMLNLTGIFA